MRFTLIVSCLPKSSLFDDSFFLILPNFEVNAEHYIKLVGTSSLKNKNCQDKRATNESKKVINYVSPSSTLVFFCFLFEKMFDSLDDSTSSNMSEAATPVVFPVWETIQTIASNDNDWEASKQVQSTYFNFVNRNQ